jgi:hypothetical protein
MKKTALATMMFLFFFQACAIAGETLNVRIQFEIPNYIRVEKKDHKLHKENHKKSEHGMRNSEREENFNAVAEIPEVSSNANWKVVVMKENEIVSRGADIDSIEKSAEKIISDMPDRGSRPVSKGNDKNSDFDLTYVFFAD